MHRFKIDKKRGQTRFLSSVKVKFKKTAYDYTVDGAQFILHKYLESMMHKHV